jgi:hypothetical protein
LKVDHYLLLLIQLFELALQLLRNKLGVFDIGVNESKQNQHHADADEKTGEDPLFEFDELHVEN